MLKFDRIKLFPISENYINLPVIIISRDANVFSYMDVLDKLQPFNTHPTIFPTFIDHSG